MTTKKINITICAGIQCSVHGGQELLDLLENDPLFSENCNIECKECQNHVCEEGKRSPVVIINGKVFLNMTPDRLTDTLSMMIQRKR